MSFVQSLEPTNFLSDESYGEFIECQLTPKPKPDPSAHAQLASNSNMLVPDADPNSNTTQVYLLVFSLGIHVEITSVVVTSSESWSVANHCRTVKLGLHCTILCRESAGVNSVVGERGREFSSRAQVFQHLAVPEP